MSVINKEPYINKILKLLTAEELETLQECINGAGSTPVFKSLVANSPYLLTTSDYGIYPVKLEIALQKSGLAQNVLEGYLIYKEDGESEGTDLCALIAYAGVAQQLLELYIMHKENGLWKWENKTCNLTIIDLRSELFDVAGGGSGGGGEVDPSEVYSLETPYLEMWQEDGHWCAWWGVGSEDGLLGDLKIGEQFVKLSVSVEDIDNDTEAEYSLSPATLRILSFVEESSMAYVLDGPNGLHIEGTMDYDEDVADTWTVGDENNFANFFLPPYGNGGSSSGFDKLNTSFIVSLSRFDLDSQPDNVLVGKITLGEFANILDDDDAWDIINSNANIADIIYDINELIEDNQQFRLKLDTCIGTLFSLGFMDKVMIDNGGREIYSIVCFGYSYYSWFPGNSASYSASLGSIDSDDFSRPKLYASLADLLSDTE